MKSLPARILTFMLSIYALGFGAYFFFAAYVALHLYPTPHPADTAIVLGAGSYHGDVYNPCLVSRVSQAVNHYNQNLVSTIIMSGGDDIKYHTNEAATMSLIAQEQGMPVSEILLEPQSTSTYENLLYSQQLMRQHGLSSALIVTEPFHIARSILISKSINLDASFSSAADSPCWTTRKFLSRFFIREPLVIGYYILKGHINPLAFLNSF